MDHFYCEIRSAKTQQKYNESKHFDIEGISSLYY
jgi:hypothetical protein